MNLSVNVHQGWKKTAESEYGVEISLKGSKMAVFMVFCDVIIPDLGKRGLKGARVKI